MKNKKYISLLCLLLCASLCLCACKKEAPPTTTATEPAKDAIYTITVKTAGGMVLEDLVAYVYTDNTEDDIQAFGPLDENGTFTFTAPQSDQYTVRFDNLPEEGYDLKEYYSLTGTTTNIVLTSSVVTGKDALETGKVYKVGDVMRDFTLPTVDGEELTLSEILKEKQAVVLNIWYTGCDPCKSEFPLLQAAYEAFSDKVEVITMNPTDISGDDAEKIRQFRDTMGLTMPMAICSSKWFSALDSAAYPTTVIIDRYGIVCLLECASVSEEGVFEAAFEHFTGDDYQQKLLGGFSELHVVEYPVGHERNPYEFYGSMENFEVTVPGQSEVHAKLFRADGIILRIEDPNAYLIVDEVRYDPNDAGVIEVEIKNAEVTVPNNLIIGNTGVTEAVIQAQLLLPQGTFSNPYEGALGNQKVTVQENNVQGVYYSWVAPAEGVLTITVTDSTNKNFDIQLYNLNSYAVRYLSEEELVDENGNRYVNVKVSEGDVVSVGYMSVPDENYKYSKVTVRAELSFVEGSNAEPNYFVTIKDGEGNPMPGVAISININGVNTEFISDENGLIAMILPSGMYTVKVTVPEGYVCETTQFLLTAANPNKDIVMTLYVPQELTYTVYVVDEEGNPVPNVRVTVLGDTFAVTDAKGMVSMALLESKDYVATIIPPDGYTIDSSKHPFGSNTVITVVVKLAPVVQQEIDYTVMVVIPEGYSYENLMVRFDSIDGAISVIQPVGSNGKAVARLLEGNYTVTLMFNDGHNMGYEPPAELTPSRTSVTVEVVPYVSGESEMIFVNGGDYEAIHIGCGSFYVDLSGVEIRYFLFTPEQDGVYTFTTNNPDAAIGYWSTSFFAFDCSAEYVKDNVCTLEVKSVGPTYVLSVKGGQGISGAILKIQRAGDIQEDTLIRENYVGTTTPTTPFVVEETGTKTYLDLSTKQTLVKGEDGFYHIGSADGPVVYMDLTGARYGISISALVNNSSMIHYEYDAMGKPTKRTDYTNCMLSYVANVDDKYGVYALTDDLIIMLQNHGKHAGWYDKDSHGYLFGTDPVLEGLGWMFLLCTIQ